MDKIIDNLYLGDIQGASNLFLLKRLVILKFQRFFRVLLMYYKLQLDLSPFSLV